MAIVCLHHTDGDGWGSAAIIGYEYGFSNVKFIPMNYNKMIPFDEIKHGDKIFIVDFSPNTTSDFAALVELDNDLVWIDHHISAIEKYSDFKHLNGIRRDGTAACELCWEYLFSDMCYIPDAIKYLGDYDVFKFAYGDLTSTFQAGLRVFDTKPSNREFWEQLLWEEGSGSKDSLTSKIIEAGKVITKYNTNVWAGSVKGYGYITEFEGYTFASCNIQGPSLIFDSVKDNPLIDGFIVYTHDGKSFKVTLYENGKDIDMSKIAIKYGGGGHKGAAGFHIDKLPFEYKEKLFV